MGHWHEENPISMPYEMRLRRYEAEKKQLLRMELSYIAYETAVRDLARKWRI